MDGYKIDCVTQISQLGGGCLPNKSALEGRSLKCNYFSLRTGYIAIILHLITYHLMSRGSQLVLCYLQATNVWRIK